MHRSRHRRDGVQRTASPSAPKIVEEDIAPLMALPIPHVRDSALSMAHGSGLEFGFGDYLFGQGEPM